MNLTKFLENKDILVTGGCGSIGSNIVKKLTEYPVKRIRVFDNNETAQFYLQKELQSTQKTRALIGDIRDKARLDLAMDGVDLVIHTAALKHVGMCEYNPFEAVQTNVIGTHNVLESARTHGVKKVLTISTDKAVNPINTMGATKLLSEKLTLNANIGETPTIFSCVRFGNVLNSNGSVIPIFQQQIKKGGPVTVTSPKMTRFFMFIEDAVNLILESLEKMEGQEIFILKMKAFNVVQLAQTMIQLLAPHYQHDPKNIEIRMVGPQPGEKENEVLMQFDEMEIAEMDQSMYILKRPLSPPHAEGSHKQTETKINRSDVDSSAITLITDSELKEIIQSLDLS
jgi:FlaA1/EpsC-like NDP-sugar epimerase